MRSAGSRKLRIALVQQGFWHMPLESMPLAAGYLKAAVMTDPRLTDEVEVELYSFDGARDTVGMAQDLLRSGAPDVLAFSVAGWNYHQFGAVADTYRQIRPDGWVIWGGNHVAHQAERTFRLFTAVDVVVHGEGEIPFPDLLAARLHETPREELGDIAGISFRGDEGQVVDTAPAVRIQNLAALASPFLTGAIPLKRPDGRFRYEAALLETNRGCPYHCGFCYWGGAVGQKVRCFPRERLREEVELLASVGVETLVLCDANFGMLPADAEFVEDLVEIRQQYGYPRALETAWAKNKSDVFHEIVERLHDADMRSSFTLSLQSLNDEALRLAGRRNMRINQWESLAAWLDDRGVECNAEMIWGLPGETPESFLEGYDKLAARTARISAYPLLLMPNTHYSDSRDEFGFITTRGTHSDFEYPLAHRTMSLEDNRKMQRFLFWARLMAEALFFRHTFRALALLGDITQSTVLLSMADFFEGCDDVAARPLQWDGTRTMDGEAVAEVLRDLYRDPRIAELFDRWWHESIAHRIPSRYEPLAHEIFRFDQITRPIYDVDAVDLPRSVVDGFEVYVRRNVEFRFDMQQVLAELRGGQRPEVKPRPTVVDVHLRTGFYQHVDSHEVTVAYVGKLSCAASAAETVHS